MVLRGAYLGDYTARVFRRITEFKPVVSPAAAMVEAGTFLGVPLLEGLVLGAGPSSPEHHAPADAAHRHGRVVPRLQGHPGRLHRLRDVRGLHPHRRGGLPIQYGL